MSDSNATTKAPAPEISRVAALDAAKAGGDAFRAGESIDTCPYSPTGGVAERFNAHYWITGFSAASSAE